MSGGFQALRRMAARPLEAVRLRRRARRARAWLLRSALFDPDFYRRTYPDVAGGGLDPLEHYLRSGGAEGRRPSPWFDGAWYLARHADVADTGQNPLVHYIQFGAAEGRDPNPFFSTRWYRTNNPASTSSPTPLDHYAGQGARALRDPSPLFDARWYAECNPDAAAAGLDPLAHFLLIGRAAGRSPTPFDSGPRGAPVSDARIEGFKALGPVAGETVALFAAYAPEGRLKPNVAPYVAALDDAGVRVVLVVASDHPVEIEPALMARLAGGFVRENGGYDFAAWAHLMRCEPGLFAAETLMLVNDSVICSARPGALDGLLARVRAHPAPVVGATDNWEFAWHLQSFFLAFKRPAVCSVALQAFFGGVHALSDKEEVIRAYEVPLAARLQDVGLDGAALFPSPDEQNQTVVGWRALLGRGFPLVKTLTLRGDDPEAAGPEARLALEAAGFDLALIEAMTAPAPAPAPPPRGAWPLLRDPGARLPAQRPWKVAFIGPWNYGSGLGEAGRGYLSALWRAGFRLNVHPIERPLQHQPRVAPAATVREFDGPADVAVIQLNPDSWTLMTEAQQAVVARARARAGLWTWEMEHVPENWRLNFDKVDAVWAPSRYCAEVFEALAPGPVAVIPHVVPVEAEPDPAARAAVLGRLGLAPEARLVLYVFDGASYLERKNPAALVRAFVRSGLADEGWSLVLKTRQLMERPEQGAALAALAETAPGVRLIDRFLSREAMAELFAAADIYASTHRSEGFGLTIAEAMARAKPVVATDYGGSRDFLDAGCGYPVPARTVRLDRDLGHYTRGGTWAEVDETAFAGALRAAAGDRDVGERARARIAERLSADAVGAAVARAIDALVLSAQPGRAA